jgi:hypothetical protein
MPSTTERQQITEALHKALLFNLIVEAELEQDAESSDSSSGTSDDNTSESDDEEGPSQVEDHLHSIAALYTDHYYNTRDSITKTDVNLQLLMEDYKINCPEIFRSYLRITPDCFNDLVSIIKDEDVFLNDSNNEQMPVAHQLAIALYRFGHYGNAMSTVKVALWAGYGYGTV